MSGPRNATGPCIPWTGYITPNGYGRHYLRGQRRFIPAHRLVYEREVGPVPAGLELDHLCRNRACVNPDHLEVVTRRENVRRGIGTAAVNARKTHCKRGHPFTAETTRLQGFRRICRPCARIDSRERMRVWRARRKVAA